MRLALCAGFAWLLTQGCGGDSSERGSSDEKVPPGEKGCLTGASLACACVDGRGGAQLCQADGTLAACECSGEVQGGEQDGPDAALADAGHGEGDAGDGDRDAGDGDGDAASGDGDAGSEPAFECKAGYYAGALTGTYWPGLGDFGFGSTLPVNVQTTAGNFSFLLDEEGNISRGCCLGSASAIGGIAGNHPFVFTFDGRVDCETGTLTADAAGYYRLFGNDDQEPFATKGTLTGADADAGADTDADAGAGSKDSDSFEGAWVLKDVLSTAANPPGGEGTYEASLRKSTAALPKECADLLAEQSKR